MSEIPVITISTSSIRKSKAARIDGHLYSVRQLGAGEQLDISQISQKLMKAGQDAQNLQAKIIDAKYDLDRQSELLA